MAFRGRLLAVVISEKKKNESEDGKHSANRQFVTDRGGEQPQV